MTGHEEDSIDVLAEAFKDAVTTPAEEKPYIMPRMAKIGVIDYQPAMLTSLVMRLSGSVDGRVFAPIKTDDGYPLVSDAMIKLQRFNKATIQAARVSANLNMIINGPYEYAAIQFIETFGKLPCGKSQRSRIKKKRKKIIIKWFEERSVE